MTRSCGMLADLLAQDGYIRLGQEFFECPSAETIEAREAFSASCSDLPLDEHAERPNRRRRYGTFVLLPWSNILESVPPERDIAGAQGVSRYVQAADLNPEQNGAVRTFAPLTGKQASSPFLRWLILKAFGLVADDFTGLPVRVGCHIIRLVALPQSPATSSPDLVHRDGEPYTLVVLLDRNGVGGGENIITTVDMQCKRPDEIDASRVLARFTLEAPWQGWMAADERTAHYVSPIHVAAGNAVGTRTVLLLDFTPMRPAPLQNSRHSAMP